jgi:hypothetical protein
MSKFKELLEKITDPDLKTALDSEFSTVNQKAGEHGRKLIEKDTEISQLREKVSETASYSEAFKLLKEKGVDTKDIPKMLEKMKVAKTLEDDLKIATDALAERDRDLGELKKFKKTIEVKTAVEKVLAEERAAFKDDKGQVIKLIDRYIPADKLYADIDVSNEVLIRERVKTVLKDGLTHQIPESQGGVGQAANLASQLKEITQKQGVIAGFEAVLNLGG